MASLIFIRQSYAYFKNKKRKSRNFFSSLANRRFLLTEFATVQNKKAARLDCFVLERKTRLEPALRVGNFSRTIFTPPTPRRGEWGRFGRAQFSMGAKRKKTAKSCLHRFERKTRLEPALRADGCSRTIFTPPAPGRGEWGSFGRVLFSVGAKRKKTAKSCLHRFERKTRV